MYFTPNMDLVIEDSCRDLGVIMDNTGFLTLTLKTCNKVRQLTGWFMRSFLDRSISFMRRMWTPLITFDVTLLITVVNCGLLGLALC